MGQESFSPMDDLNYPISAQPFFTLRTDHKSKESEQNVLCLFSPQMLPDVLSSTHQLPSVLLRMIASLISCDFIGPEDPASVGQELLNGLEGAAGEY